MPGWGRTSPRRHPAARRVFDEIDDALGFSISRPLLRRSRRRAEADGEHAAGDSGRVRRAILAALGERSDVEARHRRRPLARRVQRDRRGRRAYPARGGEDRAHARHASCRTRFRSAKGAMAAIIGPSLEEIAARSATEAAQGEVVSPANINAPGQIVIAGTKAAVDRAIDIAKDEGRPARAAASRLRTLPLRAHETCRRAAAADARRRAAPARSLGAARDERRRLADRNRRTPCATR